MSHEKVYVVDLLDPNIYTSELAQGLLRVLSHDYQNVWHRNKIYYAGVWGCFKLSHHVIKRLRKLNQDDTIEPEYRYEIQKITSFDSGGRAKLYESEGTLSVKKNQLFFKPAYAKASQRLIKIQELHKTPLSSQEREALFLQKVNYLGGKPLVVQGNLGYLIMKKLPGKTISHSFLQSLSLEKRLLFSKNLLKALKEQVTQREIIHRDLKPDNILYTSDPHNPIYIIDFGFSTLLNNKDKDKERQGTPLYAAPEIFLGKAQSTKSDVFSMGRILGLVWGALYNNPQRILEFLSNKIKNKDIEQDENDYQFLECLFTDMLQPPEIALQEKITDILQGMLSYEPEERLSVDEALEKFNLL